MIRLFRIVLPLACALLAFGATAQAQEDVLRVANVGEPKTLDPHFVSGTWENRIVGDLFMGLLTEAPDASPVAGMADSWEISEDGLTYTFTLGDHVWSDGTPVTAEDFVYSMRRILNPELAAEYASLLYVIEGAEAVNTGQAEPGALGVTALDDKTLQIKLVGPAPYFLEQLTHYTAFPVPPHVVEEHGNDWIKAENIVSNGPYVLNEWVPNAQVVLDKNPEFYDADNVAIEQVIYYPQEDRSAVQKRFQAGEIDIAKDFDSGQIDWLKENLPEQTKIAPYLGIYYYVFNTNREPFSDPRVRQALSMAIYREALTDKVLKTGEIPAYSFVPPGSGNYASGPAYVDWKDLPYAQKLERAKALLAEAGYGPDNPLELELSYNTSENHKRIAIAIQSMWKALGVETNLFNREVKVHYDKLKENDFDVARAAWIADYNDAQNFLYLLETRSGPQNYGRYDNARFNELMETAATTADLGARSELMSEAEAIAMNDQPVAPIYYYVSKNLVSDDVAGWMPNTKDIQRTRWLSLNR